jgi:ribosomal protein S9
MAEAKKFYGTGRRKSSIARVYITAAKARSPSMASKSASICRMRLSFRTSSNRSSSLG